MSAKFQYDEVFRARAISLAQEPEANVTALARKLGVPVATLRHWLKRAPTQAVQEGTGAPEDPIGVPVDRRQLGGDCSIVTADKPLTLDQMCEIFGIDRKLWIPNGFRANCWEGFYKVKTDEGHRKVRLWQTRVAFRRVVTEELEHRLLEWVQEHVQPLESGSLPRRTPSPAASGQTVVWGLWDAHLGMYAWNSEVGEDFDLCIAVRRVRNSIDDMLTDLRLYPIRRVVMPIGNDFLHFDNVRQTTTFGTHFLDCDTRYAKVFVAALECLVYMIEQALTLTDEIRVPYIPGNHDLASSFCLCVALQQRFRNEKRVVFDLRANPRKYVHWGTVIIGFDHGRDCKPDQYQLLFGTEPGAKEHWSASTWREVQVGDKHQRWERTYEGVIPTNGLLVRRNPSLCNVDAWHHSQGFIGEPMKSVEAWRYDDRSYIGSHVAWARDD